ncbi:MAG: zinc-ribbon domain-containing protein [Deltaproteobacteria bacterium]|nr:zinc-ribbon domain-containing protein [Deltaproteobacteria bacterium]
MIGRCPSCLAKFSIDDSKIGSKGINIPCGKCGTMFSVTPPDPKTTPSASAETIEAMVLVAHDSHAFCKEATRVLEKSPHDIKVIIAHDDEDLLSSLKCEPLNLILVDMALPGMFGFEVAAKIKNDVSLSHIKVILASSVYEPMGYKRKPSSLYGADDYIEAHHIHDMLVDKVVRLLSRKTPATVAPVPKPKADEPAATGTPKPQAKPSPPPPDSPDNLSAQRLARIIVSDIALYNQEVIAKGIKGGNLMKLLEKELKEARNFYVKRVPEEIRSTTNYLEDELQALFKAPIDAKPAAGKTSKPEAKPGAAPPDSPDHQKAQRLARTIVSDIALYSQEAIEKGIRNGKVMKLLEKDLKEARALYIKRVASEIRLTTNYLGDELQALFNRKRKELGI